MNSGVLGRETGTGRYSYTNFELVCECGHKLGVHSAERIKHKGVMLQSCFANDDPTIECDCQCFKPVKTTNTNV